MGWIASFRTSWRFFFSTFTRDICERCRKLKLNVKFRWRFEQKLCDQCLIALLKSADKQRKDQRAT